MKHQWRAKGNETTASIYREPLSASTCIIYLTFLCFPAWRYFLWFLFGNFYYFRHGLRKTAASTRQAGENRGQLSPNSQIIVKAVMTVSLAIAPLNMLSRRMSVSTSATCLLERWKRGIQTEVGIWRQ